MYIYVYLNPYLRLMLPITYHPSLCLFSKIFRVSTIIHSPLTIFNSNDILDLIKFRTKPF